MTTATIAADFEAARLAELEKLSTQRHDLESQRDAARGQMINARNTLNEKFTALNEQQKRELNTQMQTASQDYAKACAALDALVKQEQAVRLGQTPELMRLGVHHQAAVEAERNTALQDAENALRRALEAAGVVEAYRTLEGLIGPHNAARRLVDVVQA